LGPIAFSALGSSGVAGAALQPKVMLPQAPPTLPAGTAHLGAPPSGQQLDLDVALAGQNPSGLAQAVTAVSTPGSPDYHHYLSASQFAAAYGPSAAEVSQVSSALRSEGLTVGTPAAGSILLPVRGTAAAVSAAFATPLEQVQTADGPRALVNTSSPAVPASLSGLVTGVVGLNGLFTEHSMARQSPGPTPGSGQTAAPNAAAAAPTAPQNGSNNSHAVVAHAATPQACPAASSITGGGIYTSTQMSSLFGLNQLFGQGRTGVGQTIAIVEFEQYSSNDYDAFLSCYGLTNPIRNVIVDGGPGGPSQGGGEAALDTELAAFNAPSASLAVYEAPNSNDAQAFDLFNRIASDDSAQVVTTSWGNCERAVPSSDLQTENQIFQRMAMQGQTMIAAAGDAGSADCFSATAGGGIPAFDTELAVDDPGSQPDVISAGGTTLPSSGVAAQVVWNDCEKPSLPSCARAGHDGQLSNGATGGGYSIQWPKPTYQPTTNGMTNRAVPDLSYPSDPSEGAVVAYWDGSWHGFGGTSVAAPTNAGLFADTNQGCFATLGMIGPNLYAHGGPSNTNFTDIATGDNDFTDANGGDWPATTGYDPASGLGTPVDQNLAIALQGANGCPSVASVSPNTGPVSASGAITITGGGFANATSVTFGSVGTGQILSQSETSITVIPPNAQTAECVDVTVANSQGISASSPADHYGFGGDLDCGQGYRFVASDGGVFDFGDASFWGSTGSMTLNKPVVGMAATPSTSGYWLVASDGGIFSYGDALFYGSMGGKPLNKPIVGMAATPNGRGYWLVAADGGIFSYGNAQFFGSTGSMHLNKPIVGMAPTPDGAGYWLVASDGGIFAYGDAQFYGSTGSMTLNAPIVGMAAGPGGGGYWLAASDGGIFGYGTAQFYGSAGSLHLNRPVVGMAATPDANGYWLVAADGGIFNYGDANFYGSTGSLRLNKPIVGMSSS
jgi:subtilase family serine protease